MNQLFIIRGLPGSGKSTLAKQMADAYYEADMFFMNSEGEYQYDKSRIADAHSWCQEQVFNAMEYGIPRIAVSNTFVRRWEMDYYYDIASRSGYQVTEITMSGKLYKNEHGVPDEIIERMRASWEK